MEKFGLCSTFVLPLRSLSVVFLIAFLVFPIDGAPPKLGEFCINPAGEPGKCISIRDCEPLLHILLHKAEVSAKERMFVSNSKCSMHERQPWVCCAGPPPDEQSPLPTPPHCGVRTATRLIGGQLTQLDDDPWTALIEYEKSDGSTGFHCGGTLIDQNHILTAAHCVRSLPPGWKIHAVRLGEWDLSEAVDCEHNYCNDPPIDLNVSKIIVHEEFEAQNGNYNHDIALIRFEQQVNLSETIQPICLPLTESIRRKNLSEEFSTIVGWGKTQTSAGLTKKLRVNLRVRNAVECFSLLRQDKERASRLCSFGARSGNEVCSADSGAGLQQFSYGFQYIVGVASSEEHKCGTDDAPSSFINISNYIEWIKDQVKQK